MKDNCRLHEENLMKANRFRELLGIQIEDIKEGSAVLTLPFQEKLLQSANMIHGGVFSVLVDSVIGTAVRSVIDENMFAVTAEMNINYMRPATKGSIRAVGKVIHCGRTLAVGTADVFNEDGKLLATGRATYMLKQRKN